VPLAQKLLGAGVGADLAAAIAATTGDGGSGAAPLRSCRPVAAAPMPEVPGPLDAAWLGPHPLAVELRAPFSAQVGGGVAVA